MHEGYVLHEESLLHEGSLLHEDSFAHVETFTITVNPYPRPVFFSSSFIFYSFLLSLLPLNPGQFFLFYSQCIHLCLLTSFLFIISWKMSSCMFDPLCKSFFVHIWSVLIKLTFSVSYSSKIFNHNSTGQCHFCTKTFLCEWSLLHALALFYGVSIARV